jgi:protocatechuate 3,4-dioxygenase beta subunit
MSVSTGAAITLQATDGDGDPLSYSIVSQPQHGELSGAGPNLSYAPQSNYHGADSFTYKANDGQADSNEATVSITIASVNDVPVAESQSFTTDEDAPLTLTLAATDADSHPLTYAIVGQPQHGTLSGTPPSVIYTPEADYNGTDSFSFKANDTSADSNEARMDITIIPVNDAPVANSQTVTTAEDTAIAVTLSATDADSDALTFTITAQPQRGTLSGSPPELTYTPASSFNGEDSFAYKANDGLLDSSEATVTITVTAVNDAPVANGLSATTTEDAAVSITLTGFDAEGDPLTYTVVTQPAHGALSGSAPDLVFTPFANYHGDDLFTFKVSDGTLESDVATVSISITAVNDAPVAENQSITVDSGSSKAITLSASDVDGDPLSYFVVTEPQHGFLLGTPPEVTYTPEAGFAGTDAFTFQASDGALASNTATVSITVIRTNGAPVCDTASAQPQVVLWSPEHKMEAVSIAGVTDPDGDPVSIAPARILQDEPVDDKGEGNTWPDAILEPLQVRAERSGKGDGRVYHIEFTATDSHGLSCAGTVSVCVPHDERGASCSDGGPLYDSTQQGGAR